MNKLISKAIIYGACFISVVLSGDPVWGQEGKTNATVKSIEALDRREEQPSESLSFTSDYHLLNNQTEAAVVAGRKAVNRNPDDIEAHQSYAEALESKLRANQQVDVDLLRECVSEWLIVFRNEVGEEKGLGFHGISVMGYLYKDETHSETARQRLISLAGRAPKPWETNARYLKNVLRRASVSGKIVSPK